jgi:colanic acid biosynthesis glycosyl transferase WcaI
MAASSGKKLRILIHDYAGHPFQVQLSRALATRGHTVHHAAAGALQTPRGELARRPDDPATFTSSEVAMDPDYAKFKYHFTKRRSMEVAYGKAVGQLVREWKPDVVISANTPTESQDGLVKACAAVGARFHYWLQDFYSLAVEKLVKKKLGPLGWLLGKYYRGLDKRHFAASSSIISITQDFAPILQKEFGISQSKIHVIPNWAPLETLPTKPKDNPWSQQQQLQDKFVYLYTGTLGMKHNPGLLSALAEKTLSQPEVRVVVVSEGLGADWLKQQKTLHGLHNLTILPYQPIEHLANVMGTGDVLICVLEPDAGVFSVPSKVLSYLCAGRPALLAVPPENLSARLIQENNAGITVAPDDTAGFLAAAERLLQDATFRLTAGQNARNYAEATFDITAIADRFEEIL